MTRHLAGCRTCWSLNRLSCRAGAPRGLEVYALKRFRGPRKPDSNNGDAAKEVEEVGAIGLGADQLHRTALAASSEGGRPEGDVHWWTDEPRNEARYEV